MTTEEENRRDAELALLLRIATTVEKLAESAGLPADAGEIRARADGVRGYLINRGRVAESAKDPRKMQGAVVARTGEPLERREFAPVSFGPSESVMRLVEARKKAEAPVEYDDGPMPDLKAMMAATKSR